MDTLLAGGLAGVCVDVVLFPLDTIKTRLQTRRHAHQPAVTPAATAAQIVGVAAHDAAAKAVAPVQRSFYKGLASAMLASFPCAATFWYVYEGAKPALSALLDTHTHTHMSVIAHGGAAALADVAVTTVRNPFEVVKQQVQAGLHASPSAAVRHLLKAGGIRSFYAGYASTVMREIPFDAIEFSLYEALKGRRAEGLRAGAPGGKTELTLVDNAVLGSIAGGFAAAVTTPLDVIKTRLMTQSGVLARDPTVKPYAGWSDAAVRIFREEGWRGMFAGVVPRVAWISLGGAVFIGTFEELRRRFTAGRADHLS